MALTIVSDVPFCVYSEPALVTGRGEEITPIGPLPPMWLVIAKPQASVSTPTILRQIHEQHLNHQEVQNVVSAIKQQDFDKMCRHMGNALEPITMKKCPDIIKIKDKMLQFGADAAQMSGSGPTVFGISQKKSRATHIYNSLRGFCKEVYLVRALDSLTTK